MKEKLLQLGLTEEQAEKVLAEVEAERKEAAEKLGQLQAELTAVGNQLAEANKTMKSYQDMKIEDIKASAAEWEEKAKALETELANQKQEAALDKALAGVNAHDTEVLKGLLNREALTFGESGIEGLEEQIGELKTGKPYLFKPAEESTQYQGFEPEVSTGEGTSAMEQAISAIFN
ncbi:MAG: phage scaffolding protein [Eubacteriales bacterium]|nr:phage scaffolding protein [Eubacteriales bacterium]